MSPVLFVQQLSLMLVVKLEYECGSGFLAIRESSHQCKTIQSLFGFSLKPMKTLAAFILQLSELFWFHISASKTGVGARMAHILSTSNPKLTLVMAKFRNGCRVLYVTFV